MGGWYRYPGSQIAGLVLLDLTLALLGDWALDYNLGWDAGEGEWSGLTVFKPPVRLSREGAPADTRTATKGYSRVVHIWVFMRPLLPHNTTPSQRDPSPGDSACPRATCVPENLHFVFTVNNVLSLGFNILCLFAWLGNQYLDEWLF